MTSDFIVLASASPRRRLLLEQIDVPFEVRPSQISETVEPGEQPAAYVERIARAKAEDVWGRLEAGRQASPVLAADTAVVIDGRVLGKPGSRARALQMLQSLCGRSHDVLTAVALKLEDVSESFIQTSQVRMREASLAELKAYCETDEPLDKAGAYAIQGKGAVFVEHLSGSFSSVMGLPLLETAGLLARFGFPGWLRARD